MSISRGAPIHLSRPTAALTLGLAAMIAQPAVAQCQYAVVEPVIQGPNCQFSGPQPTIPLGMNNKGEVVGYYWNCSDANINHAFLWKPGVGLTTLPTPDGVASAFASDINDEGYIVGGHWRTNIGWSGFIRHPETGEYKYLEALHAGFGVIQTVSTANAINNANPPAVAGSRVVSEPGLSPLVTNAVLWFPYGEDGRGQSSVVDLGDMGFGPNSAANDVNDDVSSVVGWSGTLLTAIPFAVNGKGQVELADGTFGINFGFANATTNTGRIVGSAAFLDGKNLAFVWEKDTIITIEPLPGFTSSGSLGANDFGQVLVNSSNPGPFVPGIWQHGVLKDLTDGLVDPVGIIVGRGRDMNNAGQVLARATYNGKDIGVVIGPIDVPASDLNADCVTNVHDLLILLNQWGPCKTEICPADLTGNGAVGVADLLQLLSSWG